MNRMDAEVSPPRLEQIDELIQQLETTADPRSRDIATELVSLVMELHRTGLQQLLKVLIQQMSNSDGMLLRLAEDEWVGGLLLLHGLHPVDLPTRVGRALDKVRPLLKSHGGNVELVSIEEGFVRLRLQGSCHGCPSSEMTLRNAIEEAMCRFAPDIEGLEVEGVTHAHSSGLIPVERLIPAAAST